MDFGKDHYVKNTFDNTLNEEEFFFPKTSNLYIQELLLQNNTEALIDFLDILKLKVHSFLNYTKELNCRYYSNKLEIFLDGGRTIMMNIIFPIGNYYNKIISKKKV